MVFRCGGRTTHVVPSGGKACTKDEVDYGTLPDARFSYKDDVTDGFASRSLKRVNPDLVLVVSW